MKVFLVDDDVFSLAIKEQQIRNICLCETSTFLSGGAMLSRIEENPEIILIDYEMPGMNGIETLRKIKMYNPLIYVIMVSGQEDEQVIAEALESGAFEYIQKGEEEKEKTAQVIQRIAFIKNILDQQTTTEN